MARYHLTPDGPKVCSAKFRCQYKDVDTGAEPEHYDNKAAAATAYEMVMESGGDVMQGASSKSNPNSLAEKLKTEAPVDIDKTLAELYYKHAVIAGQINQLNNDVISYGARFNPGGNSYNDKYFERKYNEAVEKAERLTLGLLVQLEESQKGMDPYENEFDRRGGWTRAFLVNNVGGHVHKDMRCGTCFPTTEYTWMTDYSDKDESEIVEAAGERACTVCYPTAPTDGHIDSPTQMFTPDEIEKKKAREDRARKSEEKAAKAKAAGIFSEDGGPLKLSGRFGDVIKSERSAQIAAVERVVDIKNMERNRVEYAKSGEGHGINEEYLAERKKDLAILVEALARKNSVDEESIMRVVQQKADKKYAADLKEWAKRPANPANRS